MVTTTYDGSDLGKAKALFTSPEKAEYMKNAGVVSKPELLYLTVTK